MNHALTKFLPSFIRARLEGRATLQKILANTGWLFIDKIIRMGVGLLVGVWVARYLGPEQFGLYSYALSFAALFGTFATLGLDGIVVRNIVRDPSCKDEMLGTAFVLKLLGGALTLLLTMGAISLLRPHDNLTRWLVGITAGGMIFQAFDVIDFWFQSQVQSKYTVYVKNAAFLLVAFVKISLLLMQAPLIAFAWAGLAEIAIGSVGLVIVYHINGFYIKKWLTTISHAKKLLNDSWPLILSGIVITIYMRIDQIMLGEMIGDKAVGVYSAAVRLSEIWYFIPAAFVSSVFPSIVEVKKVNEKLYYERIQKLFNLMSVLAYAIAIPMTFLSGWLVTLLFGENYAEAGPVLAIHIWAGLFVFLGVARGSWTTIEGLMKFSFATTAIGAVVNVVLNYFFINSYGVIGAAVSTVISQFVASYGANAFYSRTRIIFINQTKAIMMLNLLGKES